ncbi:hypothetical protein SUGI_0570320 [Cryptomeria japonica]|uniref:UPF0481 protein At3g47200 n=1 Tax=Cryptomeria japonica TaxID=3369 RepID=UPI002408C7A0|nr:UPF0481 protein At3g47200 [Cryptomeria japonica]GLJ28917.1 hypothetical protein SUGI_0570320 [Cryptomeria japonica]
MLESNLSEGISYRDASSMESDLWYNHVHKYVTLDECRPERVGSENETSACMFRVSTALLKECEDAYVPQIVSIGPYHYGKEELRGMLEIKWEAVSRIVVRILLRKGSYRTSNEEEKDRFKEEMVNLSKQMVAKFGEKADDIKQCYDIKQCCDRETNLTNDFLCSMMVPDACFILEFFRCLLNESVVDKENLERFFPKFGSKFNPVVRSEIMKDLIKLENQIPLFVLEEILAMEMGESLEIAQSELQILLKAVFHDIYYRPFDYVASGKSHRRNHILDIYYYCCLGDEVHQGERQKAQDHRIFLGNSMEDLKKQQSERHKVPSAVQLEKGGLKIRASGKIQDLRFEGRTLHIPPIQLESDSEIFIRNLMALEVCSPHSPLRRMTAFVQFMNELCQTEKGAAVMRENGVIVVSLGQDSEVARLFSSCKQSRLLPSCHPIQRTRRKLIKFYSRKSRIAAAEAWNEFQKIYFSKPWFLIGGIGATIILILTAVQVFCLFHSCGAR